MQWYCGGGEVVHTDIGQVSVTSRIPAVPWGCSLHLVFYEFAWNITFHFPVQWAVYNHWIFVSITQRLRDITSITCHYMAYLPDMMMLISGFLTPLMSGFTWVEGPTKVLSSNSWHWRSMISENYTCWKCQIQCGCPVIASTAGATTSEFRQASFMKPLRAKQKRHVSWVEDGRTWTHTVQVRMWLGTAFGLANHAKGAVI